MAVSIFKKKIMNLIYHKDWRGNFGDDLNVPFFNELFPGYQSSFPDVSLYGIGTLLNDVHGPIENAAIFGSGFGYGSRVTLDKKSTKIFGVRGPLTAAALGIDAGRYVIGDPAMYVSRMRNFIDDKQTPSSKVVVALHHRTSELWDFNANNETEMVFLDPGYTDINSYISAVMNASIVYAESLHGAIIAATFGIPFVPISIRGGLDQRKWADFYALIKTEPLKALSVPNLSVPVFRKISVSGKTRGVLKPKVSGFALSALKLQKFSSELVTLSKYARPVTVPATSIVEIQNKIESAVNELREYIVQGR